MRMAARSSAPSYAPSTKTCAPQSRWVNQLLPTRLGAMRSPTPPSNSAAPRRAAPICTSACALRAGAVWATIGADHPREAVVQLQDAGILKTVMLADVVAEAYKQNLLTCQPESGVRTAAPHSGVQG